MSLKIYWERITDKHSQKAKDQLNRLFEKTEKPDVIGKIVITDLSFGKQAPSIQIIQISDPDPTILGTQSSNGIEARVKFAYHGNAYFMLETELIVNQPTPKFIVFPIRIKVSSPNISGIASVIYDEDKVCFCLLPNQNGNGNNSSNSNNNSGTGSANTTSDNTCTDILKDLKIETQMGDTSQQVLMNLGKLETFIVEQLQEMLKKHLVYPNRITIPIKDHL
ncbi:hypothetical protein DLAC_04257 [Tieghemostelium lacteum]|uniref:SMP-LTD domain-containing protein n=1 Tax=Tieghemostelium lacteum TaxID=361077 RepID=A0A151ZSG8_TIELA|nr:hypothetical protein DLAC_04257 [Tieghemostelium lacteum]|eukprot:KYQ96937.1 hypothetical protein DLAC_04257 [Tieghemostelium lacteum]